MGRGPQREPYPEQFTAESIDTERLTVGGKGFAPFEDFDTEETYSGTDSHTLTFDSDYDWAVVQVAISNPSGGECQIRINGESGSNYHWVRADGGDLNGATGLNISGGAAGRTVANILFAADDSSVSDAVVTGGVTAAPAGNPSAAAQGLGSVDFIPNTFLIPGVSAPLTQTTVVNTAGSNISGVIAVRGRAFP